MNSNDIKKIVLEQGADICGIAPIIRFAGAPEGFHPTDIFERCKSVIVFAKKLPVGANQALSCIPYSYMNEIITRQVDALTFNLCLNFERTGIYVVPIPSDDPYEYWLGYEKYGRAILSLCHADYLAGLGVMGKNTLLINDKFGNMIQLVAILTDLELEGDPIAEYEGCLIYCTICLDVCPVDTLDEETVNQKSCRPLSNLKTTKGYTLKKCNLCRIHCPTCTGIN
jgi:epoxyqueuosine reductase QueG